MAVHAYFAKPVYRNEVLQELIEPQEIDECLTLSSVLSSPVFALDIWPDCEVISFTSISDAIKQLKKRALRWFYYGSRSFRRGSLIAAGLKIITAPPITFRQSTFQPFSGFTLLSESELLVCAKPWKKWPSGKMQFVENKILPPNRAYLKLWEALTLMNIFPQAGELCLDLGASPGGWSWVLAECGATVIAVDKAPLASSIATYPNIRFQEGSAFALNPLEYQHIDWLCADIICYPERLLQLVEKWQASGRVCHMVCTLKLQGEIDWKVIRSFQAIPQSKVVHLFHNKHELCFLWSREAL